MSSKINIEIQSGIYRGTSNRLQKLINQDIDKAYNDAFFELWAEVEPTIAHRSGNFKKQLLLMFTKQLAKIASANASRFFNKDFIVRMKRLSQPTEDGKQYGRHVIYGQHGSATSDAPFKHSRAYLKYSPNTRTGTRPFNVTKFFREYQKRVLKKMREFFVRDGLDFGNYVRVK